VKRRDLLKLAAVAPIMPLIPQSRPDHRPKAILVRMERGKALNWLRRKSHENDYYELSQDTRPEPIGEFIFVRNGITLCEGLKKQCLNTLAEARKAGRIGSWPENFPGSFSIRGTKLVKGVRLNPRFSKVKNSGRGI
jgi:hypothetical protein